MTLYGDRHILSFYKNTALFAVFLREFHLSILHSRGNGKRLGGE